MAVKIAGAATHWSAIAYPPQSKVWYDGKHWCVYWYDGTGASDVIVAAYADDSDLNFAAQHNSPNASLATLRGYDLSTQYGYPSGYGFTVCAASAYITAFAKHNDNYTTSVEKGGNWSSGVTSRSYYTLLVDFEDYYWIAGTEGASIKVQRQSTIADFTAWDTAATIKTIGSSGLGCSQLVQYSNGDIGCLYSDNLSLYYKHFNHSTDTWGSEETIATDLSYFYNYRGVVTRNDKLFVIYKDTVAVMQEYLTYSETDPNSRITVIPNKVSFSGLTRNEDAYVYKDFGVDYFNGDFTHYFNVNIDTATSAGIVFVWGMANSVDDFNGIRGASGSTLGIYIYKTGTDYALRVYECDSGTEYVSGYTAAFDTTYYCKVVRDESVGTYGTIYLYIYTDESHVTQVSGSPFSITLHTSKKDFRYLYAVQSYNSASSVATTGYSERLSISGDNYTATSLKYRIRASGSWGSEGEVASDIANGYINPYFTSCADIGKSEVVYIMYYDGTNIVYKTWNGTSISSKTTMVSAPALAQPYFSAPYYDSEKIGIIYQTTANQIEFERISITPTQVSTDGILVSTSGDCRNATLALYRQVVSNYPKTFVLWTGRDYRAWARVYDHSSGAWDQAATPMFKRYWDLHNAPDCFIDGSSYVYVMVGSRANDSAENMVIKKSDYPLGHASFTLSAFSDISPSNIQGRGYKNVAVDNNNVVHVLDISGDIGEPMRIRERRSGTWSSSTNITYGITGTQGQYFVNMCLGKETSGQKSLHLWWVWSDESEQPPGAGGTVYMRELNYMKIVPQGDGTYKGYRADGVELTLPVGVGAGNVINCESISAWAASTVYSVGNKVVPTSANGHWYKCTVAGTSSGSQPTWPTGYHGTVADNTVTWEEQGLHMTSDWIRQGGGIEVIGASTPCCTLYHVDSSSPYDINGLYFYKWNGTHFDKILVGSTMLPYPYSMPEIVMSADSTLLTIATRGDYTVGEVVTYSSSDEGDTWGSILRVTNSQFENDIILLSPRQTNQSNMLYHQRVHKWGYSEVLLGTISLAKFPTPWLWWERQRKRIRHGGRG